MRSYKRVLFIILIISIFYVLVSCNDRSLESTTGTISISVVDNDSANTPIPDVEITVTPGNVVKKTDANGACSFDLPPGDYHIDAHVCCVGPGTIDYYKLVTVLKNEIKEVTLKGCLSCV
jgi:hypothetical protein